MSPVTWMDMMPHLAWIRVGAVLNHFRKTRLNIFFFFYCCFSVIASSPSYVFCSSFFWFFFCLYSSSLRFTFVFCHSFCFVLWLFFHFPLSFSYTSSPFCASLCLVICTPLYFYLCFIFCFISAAGLRPLALLFSFVFFLLLPILLVFSSFVGCFGGLGTRASSNQLDATEFFWEANISSAAQEIPIIWNPRFITMSITACHCSVS